MRLPAGGSGGGGRDRRRAAPACVRSDATIRASDRSRGRLRPGGRPSAPNRIAGAQIARPRSSVGFTLPTLRPDVAVLEHLADGNDLDVLRADPERMSLDELVLREDLGRLLHVAGVT